MATFGNLNIEASSRNITGQVRGTAFTCPEVGTGNFIMVYLDDWNAGWDVQCCLYRKSDGVVIKLTEIRNGGGAAEWYQFNFPDPKPSLLNIDYGLCVRGEADLPAKVEETFARFGAVSAYRYYKDSDVTNFPDPFDGTEGIADFRYSIYCDYTPSAGGLSIPVAMHHYGHHISKIIRG